MVEVSSMTDPADNANHSENDPDEPDSPRRKSTQSMIPTLYDELRQLAAKKLAGESAGQTLSATALVHEAYLALGKTSASSNW